MRILQVCKKFPYPIMDGEAVAVRALAVGLREAGCTVDLLSFNTSKHRVVDPQAADLPHYDHIASSDLENDVVWWKVGLSVFRKGSYHVSRFECDRFSGQLQTLLQLHRYDAVVLETAILATYIPIIRQLSDARVLLRAHNVEHEIWDRLAHRGSWILRPAYLLMARRLRRFERAWIPKADLLLPITRRDDSALREQLGYVGASHVVPVGYDVDPRARTERPISQLPFAISFIGSLDWAPNLEGLQWFLSDIWPSIHAAFPDLEFHIAGRKTPASLLSLTLPNVYVHGEVPDSTRFLARYPMMVAPILSGSGTRVKILDAMSIGRVVVATSMGLEGIDATHRSEVLICDTADDFVQQLSYLQADRNRYGLIGTAAKELIQQNFDGARIGYGLAARIRDLRTTVPAAAYQAR